MNIEIREIRLTGHQLKSLPEAERVFFVHAAHLANTIMVLQKWVSFCGIDESGPVQTRASVTQQMLAARTLAGVLYEAWNLLRKSFFQSKLCKRLEPAFSAKGSQALSDIKAYFDSDNIIKYARHKFAFHFDREEIASALSLVQDDDVYELYLSEFQGNSLYYMSEEIVGLSMLRGMQSFVDFGDAPLSDPDKIRVVHEQLYADLIRISGAFDDFISNCLVVLAVPLLPGTAVRNLPLHVVDDAPAIDAVRIPFFVSKPRNA